MTAPPDCGFGVYVHWPFCARICPYCDFNVYRDRGVDAERWARALTRELEYWAELTPDRRLDSLYFGGGTPSLAPLSVIEAAVETCDRLWGFSNAPEITLEANPTDADMARFGAFRSAGVNRLSLGVQSLDDGALAFLGRDHDAAHGERALSRALSAFPRVSADFIYALPGQTAEGWRRELRRAVASGVKHLSLYQLTIEPGTAFDRAVTKGRWSPADDDLAADLFDMTQEMTAAAGLPAYEVSNHAAPGERSRHNLIYWRQGDYVGVGPGAHGRVTIGEERRATETALKPADYLSLVARAGVGLAVDHSLSGEDQLTERLAMGLRTDEGVALSAAEWTLLSTRFEEAARHGLLRKEGGRMVASAAGRRILNALLVELAP